MYKSCQLFYEASFDTFTNKGPFTIKIQFCKDFALNSDVSTKYKQAKPTVKTI